MPFRYNKALKLFAILLFSFEMLAPAVLITSPETSLDSPNSKRLSESNRTVDLLAHLIFEEVGSEEREGKDDCLIGLNFTEVFNELQKFENTQITWSLPKDRFDTQPSLFKLHRVLLI